MPELPEVHTTVEGIKKVGIGKAILDMWSDFHLATAHGHRNNLKNKSHFQYFKKIVKGAKIKGVERKGKNILIHLSPSTGSTSSLQAHTIIIHMKMTGHVMYGRYKRELRIKNYESWRAIGKGPLQDPYNQYIHFVLCLSDGKQLVLSDMRRFASVSITKTDDLNQHESLKELGEDALKIGEESFKQKIKSRKNWPIKSALMDQTIVAGIGNIYSDETLWKVGVHPLSLAEKVPEKKLREIFKIMKEIMEFSIKHGGDSKSDYRNIFGEKGGFQNFHKVYGKKNKKCSKSGCSGIIQRLVVKGRSSHYCPVHQILYKN